jgi:hypothetical protein
VAVELASGGAGAALAGVVALGWGLLEFMNEPRSRFALRAAGWVALRLSADVLLGILAFPVVVAAVRNVAWYNDLLVILTAGSSGSAVLRSKVVQIEKGDRRTSFGPVFFQERLRQMCDKHIIEIKADAHAVWMTDQVFPLVARMSKEDLEDWISSYFVAYLENSGMDKSRVAKELKPILDILRGPSVEERSRELVRHLLRDGHDRPVQNLMRRAKQVARQGESSGATAGQRIVS